MFDFFVALFGGAYYANKFGAERQKKKATEHDRIKHRDWERSITNADLEERAAALIQDPQNKLKIISIIADIYSELPSCHDVTTEELEQVVRNDIRNNKSVLHKLSLSIMMLRHSLLACYDARHPIEADWGGSFSGESAVRGRELMAWMNKEAERRGMDARLVYKCYRRDLKRDINESIILSPEDAAVSHDQYAKDERYEWVPAAQHGDILHGRNSDEPGPIVSGLAWVIIILIFGFLGYWFFLR